MNVGLAFVRNAVRHPEQQAVFGETSLTNAELDERTNRIADLLGDRGMAKGDRIAFLVANRPEVVEVLGGITKAGLVYVGLNFRLGPVELEQVLDNARPGLVITDAEHFDEVAPIALAADVEVVDIDSSDWSDAMAAASTDTPPGLHDVRHDDDFCIVYTSGTTGRPKGVLFDHARALQHATVACLEYQIERGNRYLIQIPHNSSVNITIVPCLLVGAALGFRDSRSFDPVGFARMVEQEGVTHSFLVPTQLMRLLDRLPRDSDHALAGLTTLGYGSSPISPERLAELVDRFGPIFNQLYGMAEIASIGTILRKEDHVAGLAGRPELLSSCGQPSFAVDVRVVDPEGNDILPGERGEVIFGGPHVMKGYYRDTERTDEVLIDGWMHSGDVAEVSVDGFIFIVDRLKNLIIRGGLNIAPTEIENVLYRHPAVLEASVIGVPDPEWGEAIVAVVALKDGEAVEPEELRTHCRTSELTSIKIPERVELMESLPKNAVGKIAKNELRDQFWGEGRKV
ncbi:MAG: class I adenylate-forming enzyme family protein [Acidimicrobiales bacterium]